MAIETPIEGKPTVSTGAVSNPVEKAKIPEDSQAREKAVGEFLDAPLPDQFTFSDEIKRSICEMVKLDWQTDSLAVRPYLEGRIRDVIERYEQDVVKGRIQPFEGASTISMADVPIAVETVHPRLLGAVWNENKIHWRALNSASRLNLHNVSNFSDWVFNIDMEDLFDKIDEHVHTTTMLGTGIAMHGWEKMREEYWEMVRTINPETNGDRRRLKKKVLLRERGFVQNLNLEDFPMSLTEGSDIHRMNHNQRRFYLTVPDIMNLVARNKFINIDANRLRTNVDDLIMKDGELRQRIEAGEFSIPAIRQRFRLECINWYGKYDPTGSGFPVECEFVIIPKLNLYLSGTLLFTPDGKRPFIQSLLIPRKNFPYGIGVGELIRILADERDQIHRQRIDAGSVSLIPFVTYRAASGLQPENIILQPGSAIPVDDVNDLKVQNFSNPSVIMAGEEAQTQAQIEKLSTAGSFQQGRESELFKSRATARGTQAIIGQGNIRFSLLGKRLQKSTARLFTSIMKWYQWLMPPGLAERVLGKNGKQVFPTGLTREMVQGQFHAFLTGDTDTANKDLERKIASLVLEGLLKNPLVIRSPRRIWEAYGDWLRAFGRSDVERLQGPPPPETNFAESAERMIEQIKQGFLPEPIVGEDHIQQLAAMVAFGQSEEFRALEPERQALVPVLINSLRTEVVRAMSQAVQGGQTQQPSGAIGVNRLAPGQSQQQQQQQAPTEVGNVSQSV